MIPQLEVMPKMRECEGPVPDLGYRCPYCGVFYSIGVYEEMKHNKDMKCLTCKKDWVKE